MSRVGKEPIEVPANVKAEIAGRLLRVQGPKGKLEREIHSEIAVRLEDGKIIFTRTGDSPKDRALHGLERALAKNMVVGVSEGFVRELELIGVGYKAEMKGATAIKLGLGYSHDIDFALPEGVKGSVVKEGREIFVRLEGVDCQLLGQVAAEIRGLRKPEPYKGKGVRYRGEKVKIKAGKAGKK